VSSVDLLITPLETLSSASFTSSSTEPTHTSCLPSRLLQMGRGVPQNRERDKFQSTRFSSQLPNRPVPVDSGFQFMVLLSATILSFRAVVLINHESSG